MFNKKIINSGKTEFTSKELATICGVSIRTIDRIILRLCDSGYYEVVSEQLMRKYDRLSRILRFNHFCCFK
ncbi:HTH domain-containing protein [Clostridioides difficile]|uniref:HTH domain-containing protein n=1 Tax=Clostridioides difficile TaxID=1496 RepID=UPI001F42C730|nr:HTH domain-containing protein [Clostridioides difficile]UWD40284.1 HTH domain-containing protein [Clostridioides difficile]UWD44068.1 HTH domain-containing protein [Clostridioides difficile]